MRTITRRDWAWGAVGAGLTVALLAGYLAVRGGAWELLLPAALAGGLVAGAAHWSARRACERLVVGLGAGLSRFRESPSAASLLAGLDGEQQEVQAALLGPLEALCTAYRRALADRVAQAEALQGLRAVLERADLERGPLRTVFRASGSSRNMVARLTANLHWMTATPALQQLLGRTLAELNARPFTEVVHPEDVPTVRRALNEALEAGEVHNLTFRILARPSPIQSEPVVHHVQLDVMAQYADENRPLHLRCHVVDISDRVRAEEALRRRTEELLAANEQLRRINTDLERLKESYRDLYHHAPVMYFSLDAEGRLVACNGTLLQTLGYGRDDLFRQPYLRLLAPEEQHRFAEDRLAYQQASEVETRWIKKDGAILDVWIRNTPVVDVEGRFVRSRSVAQDVTERNRLANELRRQRDELERANATLRRINNELDEFTSVVSHDLKEPLRTIQAYSTILAEDHAGRLGPEGAEYLGHLVEASRRLGNLIDDLLTLSLAGRVLRAPQVFDLMQTVRTVCQDLADLISRRGAVVRVAGSLPAVVGDETRVAQLLANLIGNGLKYNTSLRPEVVIGEVVGLPLSHSSLSPPGGEGRVRGPASVTLYVRDNGIGIDPRFQGQVFSIFRRLHPGGEYEGTGAGLAICKKIVEAHGGRIWLESVPGQGSTFFFTLPAAPAGAMPATDHAITLPSQPPIAEETPSSIDHPPARILLVEDMPEIGLVAQRLGGRAGHIVDWLTTAEAAWDHLQRPDYRPDLILLDINLPGMSGTELCQRLRATPELAGLTIALFSQMDRPEALSAGRAAGADFILSKDLLSRPAVWQRRLQEILTRRKYEVGVRE
jgi:PAS domain S-box-containing protein